MSAMTTQKFIPDPALYPELAGDASGFERSTIREEDSSHALEILIGSYTDPTKAVVRELIINAIDAHTSAGQTQPVQVRLPTPGHPELVISDAGLGLSVEDMIAVYTHPGASTKREDTSVTGELGIGAKAPYTVTDRFVVRGVKDGVAATLVMARIDGDLMHSVRGVTSASGEHDGVTVTVPVDPEDTTRWVNAAVDVAFWLEPGAIEIANTDEISRNFPNYTQAIADHPAKAVSSAMVKPRISQEPVVLMGSVAYEIPPRIRSKMDVPVMLTLPAKTLAIAPTRESILDDQANLETILEIISAWRDEITPSWLSSALEDDSTSMVGVELVRARLMGDPCVRYYHKTNGINDHGLWHRAVDHQLDKKEEHARKITVHTPSLNSMITFENLAWAVYHAFNARRDIKEYMTWEQAHLFEGRGGQPKAENVVFVDRAGLSKSMLSKMTRYARIENIIVVVLDRKCWIDKHIQNTKTYFDREKSVMAETQETCPRVMLRSDEDIEWVSHEDLKQTLKETKREKAPEVGDGHIINVVTKPNRGYTRTKISDRTTATTAGELIKSIRKDKKAVLVHGKANELDEKLSSADFNDPHVHIVSTGERALKYVLKNVPRSRQMPIFVYGKKKYVLALQRMTPTQRRDIADITLLSQIGAVRHIAGYINATRILRVDKSVVDRLSPEAAEIYESGIEAINSTTQKLYKKHEHKRGYTRSNFYEAGTLVHQLGHSAWVDEHTSLSDYIPMIRTMIMVEGLRLNRSYDNQFDSTDFDTHQLVVSVLESMVE